MIVITATSLFGYDPISFTDVTVVLQMPFSSVWPYQAVERDQDVVNFAHFGIIKVN